MKKKFKKNINFLIIVILAGVFAYGGYKYFNDLKAKSTIEDKISIFNQDQEQKK